MSDELHDTIDDTGLRSAFDGYRADPGGDVRIDAAAIAGAGRTRVRRNRAVGGVAGVAVLVAGAVTVPALLGGHDRGGQGITVAAGGLPSTGRNASDLFAEAKGKQEGDVKAGGDGAKLGATFAAGLGSAQPGYLDAGWQPAKSGTGSVRWALLTWAKDGKAAEGLLSADDHPVFIAVFPPPYRTCTEADKNGGRTCEVHEVTGKGWLKIVHSKTGDPAKVTATFLRMDGKKIGTQYAFALSGGAATKVPLAGGRTELGALPVSENAVTDALTALP
ncbi:MAG: hypothetical protein QOJ50_821 [Cryptosporangiaceae bacterium]|nr:hypothetical protein [Cryptosporangiaceae bacterium]